MKKRTSIETDNGERRKQARLHKLGTNHPRCAVCGNADWRVIEEHHPDTRKHDNLVVLLCANDHRIVTDDQKDHPKQHENSDNDLFRIGNFLLGLADMLKLILDRLYEYGSALIEKANSTAASSTVQS